MNEIILSFADLENKDSITIEFKPPYNIWKEYNKYFEKKVSDDCK